MAFFYKVASGGVSRIANSKTGYPENQRLADYQGATDVNADLRSLVWKQRTEAAHRDRNY